jgi:hypothetical protein
LKSDYPVVSTTKLIGCKSADKFTISDKKKLAILKYLADGKWHSYYDVQKKLAINYNSLKKMLLFLEWLEAVDLSVIEADDSSTGKGSYKVRITKNGIELIK